jgi:uncharacterized protein DUF742
VKILVSDLIAEGRVTARHPSSARNGFSSPDAAFLKKVLVGLHNL